MGTTVQYPFDFYSHRGLVAAVMVIKKLTPTELYDGVTVECAGPSSAHLH